MLTLSKAAGSKVKNLLSTKKDGTTYYLRVGVRGGGCSGFSYYLDFDEKLNNDDKEIKSEGVNIVVDKKSYLYLLGTTIDYVDDLSGQGFKFKNPQARRTCGCGESFSI